MVRSSTYLLKITASRMKLRCSLRGSKEACIVVNFVRNRVCHVRGDTAYSSSIIRVCFRVGDIPSSIISPRCNIMLRYHTFWSLVAFINLSADYLGGGSFCNQFLLSHLLSNCNWRRINDLRWLWLRHDIVPFLVRLDNLMRTSWTHIIVVSFRWSIIHLIIIPMSCSCLWSVHLAITRHSLSRCCRHCMLWCKLLLHMLEMCIVRIAMRGCCLLLYLLIRIAATTTHILKLILRV